MGLTNIDELINQTIPSNIRLSESLELPDALSEQEYAEEITNIASKNKIFASYIGMDGMILLHQQLYTEMYLRTGMVYFIYTLSGGNFAR